MRGGFLLHGWVVVGVSGSPLGLVSMLGDDLEDLDGLSLAFLGDVVEGVVDGIGEFLYELVRGDLIERGCHGVVLEDLIG